MPRCSVFPYLPCGQGTVAIPVFWKAEHLEHLQMATQLCVLEQQLSLTHLLVTDSERGVKPACQATLESPLSFVQLLSEKWCRK